MSNYSAWPALADVTIVLDSLGIVSPLSSGELAERVQQISDQVTAEVTRVTQRQFIADTADTVRGYDGTGHAELEIDEFVSFTGAAAIGLQADPGYPLDNVIPIVEQDKPMTRLIRGVGSLPAFPTAAVYQPVPAIFPAGRANILVTATFGFGTSVPPDLWQTVCAEIARRVAAESIAASSLGRTEVKEGDIATAWAPSATSSTDLASDYRAALRRYRRPSGRRLRNLFPRMI